jgi:N-acetylmuramoyl-L-alanine amidase
MKKQSKSKILFVVCAFICIFALTFTSQKTILVSGGDLPSSQFVVVIDAGHGGIDPGGIGISTKVKEADVNLQISKKLEKLLSAAGLTVIMTRENENGLYGIYTKNYKKIDMAKRKEIIEKANPDVVVSVHINRFSNKSLRGAQAFYDDGNELGAALAECVQTEFNSQLEATKREPSTGDYFMVKCTETAAIIAECGYLSNEEDERLLQTEAYQNKVAYSIFCGIVRYLSVPNKIA